MKQTCRSKHPGLCRVHGGGQFSNMPALVEHMKALHPGLQLVLREKGRVLDLDLLIVPKNMRRSGVGKDAMEHLISYADAKNLEMILSPEDVFGTPKQTLIQFYQRFGFEPLYSRLRGQSPTIDSMRRVPSV